MLDRKLIGIDHAMVEAVRRVKEQGLKLVICSNTPWQGAREWERDRLVLGPDNCFEGYISSFDIGFAKPNPVIFEAALPFLGVSSDEAAMVGDDLLCDIGGAHAVGMRTVWKRPTVSASSSEGPAPDVIIESGSELMGVLKPWL